MKNKQIDTCPICDGTAFSPFISAVDYTVSNSVFNIVNCNGCNFHFTNPIPLESEIGNYYKSESYISHSSTNKGLINKVYQLVRRITLKRKVKLIDSLVTGRAALDIGSGTGHFYNALRNKNYDIIGLEPDVEARKLSKELFNSDLQPLSNLYNLEKESFDCITMWHVLEHVYHLKKDLSVITNLLKSDGKLIVAVPNKNSYDASYYKEFWAAYDLPIHLYHFTPNDIYNLSEMYNLNVEAILPMKFDSYYVSMLSEKYKGGNIISAVWRGFLSNIYAKPGTYSSQIYILSKKGS